MRLSYDTVGAPSRVLRVGAAVVVAVVVLLATVANAQERDPTVPFPGTINWTPIVFLAAGQMADGATTAYKVSRGCGESNVGVYTEQPSSGRVLLVKGVTTGAIAVNMAIWQKMGHPKIAKWFGIVGGAVGFGAAGYNMTVRCGR